jgi:hypothetical protein
LLLPANPNSSYLQLALRLKVDTHGKMKELKWVAPMPGVSILLKLLDLSPEPYTMKEEKTSGAAGEV